MNTIAVRALRMAQLDERKIGSKALGSYNVYFGPHIRQICCKRTKSFTDSFVDTFSGNLVMQVIAISILRNHLNTGLSKQEFRPERI